VLGVADAALSLQPQLQKSYADLQAAETQIAPAQQKLHLASLPLQNTDCAGDTKKNDPTCRQLDAAYEVARSEVLSQLGPVKAAASAYTKIQASYGKAVADANTVCVVQLAVSIPALVGDDWALLQSLYGGLNDLVTKAAASSAPDLTAILVDLIPRPRPDVGGQFAGTYLFRGIAGQNCQIQQQPNSSIVAITEKGDRGQGKVTGANTFTVTFSFGELQGTLSADGKEIKWSNVERWVRT
jgi:hypothetical protein